MSHSTTSGGVRAACARGTRAARPRRRRPSCARSVARRSTRAPRRAGARAPHAARSGSGSRRLRDHRACTCASSSAVIVAKSFVCSTSRGENVNAASSVDLVVVVARAAARRRQHRLREPRRQLGRRRSSPARARARAAAAPPPSSRGACGLRQNSSNACSNSARCSRREHEHGGERLAKVVAVRDARPLRPRRARRSPSPGRPAIRRARSTRTKCSTFSARRPRGGSVAWPGAQGHDFRP